jgi:hypothetical protein
MSLLAEVAPNSIPKIPSVSMLLKTFPMAYGLILKTTTTNIINTLHKILIISPLCPTTTVCFRFNPNLPDAYLVNMRSCNPYAKIPIPRKPSKSGLIEV